MKDASPLNADISRFLVQYNAAQALLPKDLPVPECRKLYEELTMLQGGIPLKIARVEDLTIPSRYPEHRISVRVYSPNLEPNSPAILYLHGGGWQMGSLNTHDPICRHLAIKSQSKVISVEMRLAPEFQFPYGFHDCLDAYLWLRQDAKALGIDETRIALAGDSAGGNLAAAMINAMEDEQLPMPACQVLFYPALDLSCSTDSYRRFAEGFFLTTERILSCTACYLSDKSAIQHPYVSPLRAEDFSHLPPTIVLTAAFDPLSDEGEAYANKAKAAGVVTDFTCYPGMVHGFLHFLGTVPKVSAILDETVAKIKKAWSEAT